MGRLIVAYLCVYLVFPAQVWGQSPAPTPPVKKTETAPIAPIVPEAPKAVPPAVASPSGVTPATTPVAATGPVEKPVELIKKKDLPKDREILRNALHLATWKVGALVRARIPGIQKFLVADHIAFFQPYAHCKSPFGTTAVAEVPLAELYASLATAQKAYADFLKGREKEIGQLAFRYEPFQKLPNKEDLVESQGAKCHPFFDTHKELIDETGKQPEAVARLLKRMAAEGKGFMDPPMSVLIHKVEPGDTLTTYELKNLILISHTLRKYSRLIVDQARMHRKDGGLGALPELNVTEGVGKRLALLDARDPVEIAKAKIQNNRPLEALRAKELVPRFVRCADKATACGVPLSSEKTEGYCLCDAKEEKSQEMEESIILGLQPPDPAKPTERPHKSFLTATQKLFVKGRLVNLAASRALLPKSQWAKIPQACLNRKEFEPFVGLFNDLTTFSPKQIWLDAFSKSVDELEQGYREGRVEFPVPSVSAQPIFYSIAGQLAQGATRQMLGQLQGQASAGALFSLQLLEALPFHDRIREGDRLSGQDLASHFGQKLKLWAVLAQNDLQVITDTDKENRAALLSAMIRQVIVYALSDSLQVYVSNSFRQVSDANLALLWDSSYRARWETYLTSNEFEPELQRMAQAVTHELLPVTERLLNEPLFKKKADPDAQAHDTAQSRVRQVMPMYDEAVRADQAALYMQTLLASGSGAASLAPWSNFNNRESKIRDTTQAPAAYQMADGFQREDLYPFFSLDPVATYDPATGMTDPIKGKDYDFVKKGLQSIVGRQRDPLTKKYKARGFTDPAVRHAFAQGIDYPSGRKFFTVDSADVMTGEILAKFNEVLEADPQKDTDMVSATRRTGFSLLRQWLTQNPQTATAAYEKAGARFSEELYETYFRPLLARMPKDGVEDKAWQAHLDETVKIVTEREIQIGSPNIPKVLELHAQFKNEEATLERLFENLSSFVDPKGVLHSNHAFDSADQWAKFATEYKSPEGQDALAWFDDATSVLGNQYVGRFFQERAVFGTRRAMVPFLMSFGPKGIEYKGEATLADLKTKSEAIGKDEPYPAYLDVVEWDGKAATPEKAPTIAVSVISSKSVEVEKATWAKVWVQDGKTFQEGHFQSVRLESVRLNSPLPPRTDGRALYLRRWLQDGKFEEGKWDPTLVRVDLVVPPVMAGNMPVTERAKAKATLEVAEQTRIAILRDAWYGQEVAQINDPLALPDGARTLLPQVDAFLSDFSHRVHGKAHAGKDLTTLLLATDYYTKKVVKEQGLYEGWHGRTDVVREMVRVAIEKKDTAELKALFPHMRFLFARMPVFLRGLNAKSEVPSWAKEDFLKALPRTLLPPFERFRSHLGGLMTLVEAAKKDPVIEITEIEKSLAEIRQALWMLDRRELSLYAWVELGRRHAFDSALKLTGYEAHGKFDEAKARREMGEKIENLTEVRDRARVSLKAFNDLQRLLSHYLPELPESKAVRLFLAGTLKPALWQSYFEDQFLKSSTDSYGKPLQIEVVSGGKTHTQVTSPDRILEDLNEIAKSARATAPVTAGVATEYLEDVMAYCKAAQDPRVKEAFAKQYQSTLLAELQWIVAAPVSGALAAAILVDPARGTQAMHKNIQVSLSRLKQVWNLNPARTLQERKQTFADISQEILAKGFTPQGRDLSLDALHFPSVEQACSTLQERAQTVHAQVQADWNAQARVLPATAQAYWEEVVEPATALFHGPVSTFGPLVLLPADGKEAKDAWFRHGPTHAFPQSDDKKAQKTIEGALGEARALVEFFKLPTLTPEILKRTLGDKATYSPDLVAKDIPTRIAAVNSLSLAERSSLYTQVQNGLSQWLMAQVQAPSFFPRGTGTGFGTPKTGTAPASGLPPRQPADGVKTATITTTPPVAQAQTKPAATVAGQSPAQKPTQATAPTTTATKPATEAKDPKQPAAPVASATPTKKVDAASAEPTEIDEEFEEYEAFPLAPPVVPAAAAAVGLDALFPATSQAQLTYDQWLEGMRSHLRLWESLKKDDAFTRAYSAAPTVGFEALTSALFSDFVSHTPYRLSGHRLSVPPSENMASRGNDPGIYGPAFLSAVDMSFREFRSYSNFQKREIIEDIRGLILSEEARLSAQFENAEQEQSAKRFGLSLPKAPKGKVSEEPATARPFENGILGFRNAANQSLTAKTQLLTFYEKYFSKDSTYSAPKSEYPGLSLSEWRSYWIHKNLEGKAPYLVEEKSQAFKWTWSPAGKQTQTSYIFQNWITDLKQDAAAQAAFGHKAARRFQDGTFRLWDRFDSIEAFTQSSLFGQFQEMMQLADRNARTLGEPGTYPYFLALLNWNLYHFGTTPVMGASQGLFKNTFRAGLMQEVVDHLGWNLKNFDGWRWIIHSWGRAQDLQLIASSKRDALVAIGDRRPGNTLVAPTYVSNPNWAVGQHATRGATHAYRWAVGNDMPVDDTSGLGATYVYRPTPVHPSQRTSYGKFDSRAQYLEWVQNPRNTLAYRVNTDTTINGKRPLYHQMVASQGELVGEWNLREKNPLKRDEMERIGKLGNFGAEYRYIDSDRANAITQRAQLSGVKTAADEITRLVEGRETWLHAKRAFDELRVKYRHEGMVLMQRQGNSAAINTGWLLSPSAARLIPALVKKFALQVGYTGDISLPSYSDSESYLGSAQFELGRIMDAVTLNGATPQERKRIESVLGVISDFYTEESLIIEYQRGAKTISDNIVVGLEKLCKLDVENVETDEQFAAVSEELKDSGMAHFDSLIEFVNEYLPEGANHQAYRLLMELKIKRSLGQRIVEDYVDPMIQIGLGVMLVASVVSNPETSGFATAFASYASQVSFSLYFAYQVTNEVAELYWWGPERIGMLSSLRDNEISYYLPLMKDDTGIQVGEAGREHAVQQASVTGWVWRGWLLAASWQLASPVFKALKGKWNVLRRWTGGEVYARKQLTRQLKIFGLTEEELAGKNAAQLQSVFELRSQQAFKEAFAANETFAGHMTLDADLAKSYQALVEKRIAALKAQGQTGDALRQALKCRAEVNSATPFLSQDSATFLHPAGGSITGELMPTALRFLGVPENGYRFFNWGLTRTGQGMRRLGATTFAGAFIRPTTLLNGISPVVQASQASRQLLVFRRLVEWRQATNLTLARAMEAMGLEEKQALELLNAYFDEAHPLAKRLRDFLPAKSEGRNVEADARTLVEELAKPQGALKLELQEALHELKNLWALGGLPADVSSEEFARFLKMVAEKDFNALAFEMSNPNRVLLFGASIAPGQEKQKAASGALPPLDAEAARFVKQLNSAPLELATSREGYFQLLREELSPAEWDLVQPILQEGLSSEALELRLGVLRYHSALTEDQIWLQRQAIRCTRAMEISDARLRFHNDAFRLEKALPNPQAFANDLRALDTAPPVMTWGEARGIVFGNSNRDLAVDVNRIQEYFGLRMSPAMGGDKRLVEEAHGLLLRLARDARPGTSAFNVEALAQMLSVPPRFLVAELGARDLVSPLNTFSPMTREMLLGRTLPKDPLKQATHQLTRLLSTEAITESGAAREALGFNSVEQITTDSVYQRTRETLASLEQHLLKLEQVTGAELRELLTNRDAVRRMMARAAEAERVLLEVPEVAPIVVTELPATAVPAARSLEETERLVAQMRARPAPGPYDGIAPDWEKLRTRIRERVAADLEALFEANPLQRQAHTFSQKHRLIEETTDAAFLREKEAYQRAHPPTARPQRPVVSRTPQAPAVSQEAAATGTAPLLRPTAPTALPRRPISENPRVATFLERNFLSQESIAEASENGAAQALDSFVTRAYTETLVDSAGIALTPEAIGQKFQELKLLHLLETLDSLETAGILTAEEDVLAFLRAGQTSFVRTELHQVRMNEDIAVQTIQRFASEQMAKRVLMPEIRDGQFFYGELMQAHQKAGADLMKARAASPLGDFSAEETILGDLTEALEQRIFLMQQFPVEGTLVDSRGLIGAVQNNPGHFPLEFLMQPEITSRPQVLEALLGDRSLAGQFVEVFGERATSLSLSASQCQRLGFDLQIKERWLSGMNVNDRNVQNLYEITARAHRRAITQGGSEVPEVVPLVAAPTTPRGPSVHSTPPPPRKALWLPGDSLQPPPTPETGPQ